MLRCTHDATVFLYSLELREHVATPSTLATCRHSRRARTAKHFAPARQTAILCSHVAASAFGLTHQAVGRDRGVLVVRRFVRRDRDRCGSTGGGVSTGRPTRCLMAVWWPSLFPQLRTNAPRVWGHHPVADTCGTCRHEGRLNDLLRANGLCYQYRLAHVLCI